METDQKLEINIEKLQDQVRRELLADEKYSRENSAKLRAVEQRVPTYEDFRQMVLASHLKPLDKGESLRDSINASGRVWNSAVSNDSTPSKSFQSSVNRNQALFNQQPKTNLELLKTWKYLEENNVDLETKWKLLTHIGLKKLEQLLLPEINGDLMGNLFKLFQEMVHNENTVEEKDTQFIVDLLKLFPKCNRFNLNFMFLNKDEIEACKNVVDYLVNNQFEITDLKKCYFK